MSVDLDALIESSVITGQIVGGAPVKWVVRNCGDPRMALMLGRSTEAETKRPMPWSLEDINFVREHVGILSDAEIGERLGRTAIAIKIKRTRLALGSATRREDWFTSRGAAKALGMPCAKKIVEFIENGWLVGYSAPLDCTIHQIHLGDLKRFACNPEHWVYFDPKRVNHPEIRRLVLRQMVRWGDEWWESSRVAKYHNLKESDISRYMKIGRIHGIRHGKWYVRRSVATDPNLVIYKGRGGTNKAISDNYREWDALVVFGVAAGLSYGMIEHISKTKLKTAGRYQFLENRCKLGEVVEKYALPVVFNAQGCPWVDWRLAAKRFPFFRKAIERFVAGRKCSTFQYRVVGGALHSWARFHARNDEERAAAEKLQTYSMVGARAVQGAWNELKTWGLGDPLECPEEKV